MTSKGISANNIPLSCGPFRKFCCAPARDQNERGEVYESQEANKMYLYGEEAVASPQLLDLSEQRGPGGLCERPPVILEDGARYKGQWRGLQRHGHGILTRSDGGEYEGGFENNRAHGRGVFTEASGTSFEGQWDQDRKHGFGKYVHVDGTTYEGEWGHDEKSGRGVETWFDGARYEGEFWTGRKHGVGIYRSGTGVQYEGQFRLD